jgi:Zinc-ribbon containing domain
LHPGIHGHNVPFSWDETDALGVEEDAMAEPVPAGSDVSAGIYQCDECGYELDVASIESLPSCPECSNGSWDTESGGESGSRPRWRWRLVLVTAVAAVAYVASDAETRGAALGLFGGHRAQSAGSHQ